MNWLKRLFKRSKYYKVSYAYKLNDMVEENIQTIAYVKARDGEEAIDYTKKLIYEERIPDWDSVIYWQKKVDYNGGYLNFLYSEFKID